MDKQTFADFATANAVYEALEARADVTFCDICRNKATKQWMVRHEVAAVVGVSMADRVYAELVRNQEGGGSVYLDNVDFAGLGISRHQFAGYLSALEADGRYKSTGDSCFGRLTLVD